MTYGAPSKTWDDLARDPISVRFGRAVRDARIREGLTQEELCRQVGGVDQGWMSRLENGKVERASLATAVGLIRLLGIDVMGM